MPIRFSKRCVVHSVAIHDSIHMLLKRHWRVLRSEPLTSPWKRIVILLQQASTQYLSILHCTLCFVQLKSPPFGRALGPTVQETEPGVLVGLFSRTQHRLDDVHWKVQSRDVHFSRQKGPTSFLPNVDKETKLVELDSIDVRKKTTLSLTHIKILYCSDFEHWHLTLDHKLFVDWVFLIRKSFNEKKT